MAVAPGGRAGRLVSATRTRERAPRRRAAQRSWSERERRAEAIACRLDAPFTLAGIVFVLVVVADNMTAGDSALKPVLTVAAWGLWAVFVVEFALRLVVAPSTVAFLRRNWWQLAFLLVPFLRFLRTLSRSARLARVASTSVRGARTAGRNLAGRVGWVVGATVSVVLGASEILYEYGPRTTYPRALHDVLLGAVGGEPLPAGGAVADALEVFLVLYATVVFATLAGVVGAFLMENDRTRGRAT